MIPSVNECVQIMEAYDMPDNIRAHSFVVAKIAHLLAKDLQQVGEDISIRLVTAGALLHDIGKAVALKQGGDHSLIGREICLKHSMPEIAEIVTEHVRLKSYDLDGRISEKEIVYYSDKRVNHDQVVTLDERLKYILERYGVRGGRDIRPAIKENFRRCRFVEEKIFLRLKYRPIDLRYLIRAVDLQSI